MSRTFATTFAAVLLGAAAAAQTPLFTIVQTSDSQAGSEAEWDGFEDVLQLIANAGKPGALVPRAVDLVLFPGDLTEGNDNTDWVRCRNLFDTYLTANNIPLLCTPGNRDQGSSANQTQLYQQYIGSAGVWETGSASWTGQNGKSRTTGWAGLRFIGFNSSNGAWNKISDADIALIDSRVDAAANADENILLVTHHPHNGQSRIPLASILTEPSIVAYVRGHSGDPKVSKGLSGVNNPNAWDLNTNAIVDDRDAIYYEVFQTQIKVYLIVLNDNPTSIGSAQTIQLVYPLRSPTGAQNIGYQGGNHSGARAWPTGFAPDKKLWSQGGNWFGVLWSESASAYRIFRLETSSQTWVDTGTSVSSTSARSFDALADGTKLYLASHYQSAPSAAGAGQPGQVLRYSYNAASRTYALDAGFPVNVNDVRTESLGLARDSFGTLWATWTAGGQVFTARTLGDDATWSAGVALPLAEASGLDGEDVSALVAFAGKLACVWTDRTSGAVFAATREDGLAPGTWLLESALDAPGAVTDVLDVTTSAGKLYVANASSSGIVRVLKREVGAAGSGAWTQYTVADAATGLSQPIVLVDEAQARLRVYATGASASGGSSLGAGVVYEKTAPLSTLSFGPGKGTIVLQDGQNFAMGRATSTRQALSNATGLAVVASNELSQRNWHTYTSLGTPPPTVDADFSASPRSGTAPLLVHFSDLSTGAPTSWLWTFGDGTTSAVASPDHVYASPGTYTVALSASNSSSTDSLSRSAYVTVTSSTPTVTLTAVADSTTSEQSKDNNLGTNNTIRVKDQGNKDFRAWVKFDLSGVGGTIQAAKLRLWCVDSGENGGVVYPVSSSWSEGSITWNNQPVLPASSIASLGSVGQNAWKEIDVSSAVGGGGLVSFALSGGNNNVVAFTSREGSNKPQLVLTVQSAPSSPVADFSGSPLSGTAPLAVQFSDLSSGTPTSWSWSFGDSGTATQKNPLHSFTTPGTYTVSLTATNSIGSNTRTRTSYVTVLSPGGGPGQTFLPVADSRVYESSAGSNYGADTVLRMKTQAGSSYRSFMQFDLSTLSGTPTSAKLRIFVTDESNSGGSVYLVPNTWAESTITWSFQPALPPSPVASAGAAPVGAWLEFDVSSAVLGPGIVSFGHAAGTTNSIYYSSREGANPPQLVVETAGP